MSSVTRSRGRRSPHACPECGRPWALRGSRLATGTWGFWCRFCDWRITRGARRAPLAPARRPLWAHGVHLYAEDADLISSMTAHLAEGWSAGGVGLVVATPEHRRRLRVELERRDLDSSTGGGRLIELDAEDTLRLFMLEGSPDRTLFDESIGSLVREAAAQGPVHAFGEMVDVLWARGEAAAALELEGLWSDLQRRQSFSLLCGYADAHVDGAGRGAIMRAHDHVAA